MKTQKLKVLLAGLVVLSMGWVGKARAASTDTITLSLTPNATYSVMITSVTAGVGYQFGSVNLNATTVSTAAIVVTNNGSIYEFFALSVSNTSGGGNPWTTTGAAPSTDTFRLSGQFNTSQPAEGSGSFSPLTNSAPTVSGTLYGQASTKTSPTPGQNTLNLWLQMETPYTLNTGGSGAQSMTLSVTGQAT